MRLGRGSGQPKVDKGGAAVSERGATIRRPVVWCLVALIAVALFPIAARAQDTNDEDDDVLVRVNADVRVGPGERVGTLIVINGDATVEGTVENLLLVIRGTATVSGRVDDTIVAINGDLDLRPGAVVNDVNLVRSTLTRDPGATVNGSVNERSEFQFSFGWGVRLLFWLSFTVVVVAAGLVFAGIGGRQLREAAAMLTGRVGSTIVAALVLWIAVPVLAVISFVTLIGIPLGLSVLLLVLPALWFLGYLVTGTRLGDAVLSRARPAARGGHPYLQALVGLVLLQAIGLLPFIGWLIVALAGLWGGGAVVLRAIQGWWGAPGARQAA